MFDGHGGREVAEFAAANLVRHLAAHLETNEPPAALHKTFLALNEELSTPRFFFFFSGNICSRSDRCA